MGQLGRPTVKNPDLVAAIEAFKAAKNPENENAMLEEIEKAQFIAPIELPESLENVPTDENGQKQTQARLLAVSSKDAPKMFPAFTDWLEFLKWKNDPDADTMVITFDQYCDILLKQNIDVQGIVINPAETGVMIRKQRMAQIKGVTLPEAPKSASAAGINRPTSELFGAGKVSNDDLVAAIDALKANNNRDTQSALFRLIQQARFVIPAFLHDMPQKVEPNEKVNAKAEFIMLTHDDKKHLPLFTSMEELEKWPSPPDGCVGMPLPYPQIVNILADPKNTAAGIVINPFSQGLGFAKEQAMAIAPRLEIAEAKEFPLDMMHQLKDFLPSAKNVTAAYFSGAKANGKPAFLIVLDIAEGKQLDKKTGDAVSNIVKAFGPCVLAPASSPLGKKAIENKTPFYEA